MTGAELADAIEREAERRDMTAVELASSLSRWPGKWLYQLRIAARPKPATIARVQALLAGEAVPPAPPNNFWRNGPPAPPAVRVWREPPPEALPPRVYRDPCPRCGVRGDVGCSHRASRLLTGGRAYA